MKKYIIKLLIIITLFLLTACGSNEEVVNEFIDYYNDNWIPIQVMKSEKTDRAKEGFLDISLQSGEEEKEQEELIALYKNEIIPIAEEVLKQLKSVELKHREVKKANDLQIEAEEFALNILENTEDLFKGNISEKQYKEYDDQLKEKYDTVLDYRDELIEKYDLEYDKEKGKVDGFYELKHREKE